MQRILAGCRNPTMRAQVLRPLVVLCAILLAFGTSTTPVRAQRYLFYNAQTGAEDWGSIDSLGFFSGAGQFYDDGAFRAGWTHITNTRSLGILVFYDGNSGN